MNAYHSLLRHFTDLAEGNHDGAQSRAARESLFQQEVKHLESIKAEILTELNGVLLRGTGQIQFSGVHRTPDGGLLAHWTLEWAGQRRAGSPPVTLMAYYRRGFHHPHLRAATVGEWPLNTRLSTPTTRKKSCGPRPPANCIIWSSGWEAMFAPFPPCGPQVRK